jgi:hypothetical protein
MWTPIGIFVFMLDREQRELERIQNECLEIQRATNRDWDIRLKHISNLNNELTRIHREHSQLE